ncbi:hypothetical protein V1523DRAFT_414014 [Lipomyces doorenjongii]
MIGQATKLPTSSPWRPNNGSSRVVFLSGLQIERTGMTRGSTRVRMDCLWRNMSMRCLTILAYLINVDDDYKIVTFTDDQWDLGGRQLDPVCRDRNSEQSPRDELLRWHFRQAVLANMR